MINLEKEVFCTNYRGYTIEELNWHIDKLHEYNDVRDAAQVVLGQLGK